MSLLRRTHKYGARRVRKGDRADGRTFDSQEEARQFDALRLREIAGEIVPGSIRTQVRYALDVNGAHVCDYVADFVCRETAAPDVEVVIDAKGFATPEYKIKRALMRACHGIEIREVGRQRKSRPRPRAQRKTAALSGGGGSVLVPQRCRRGV